MEDIMKKITTVIAVMIALEGMACAGNIPTKTMGGKDFTFKQSSNVSITYYTTNAATTPAVNTDYVTNTKNGAGNRLYSSSNNTSNIWYKEDDTWKGKDVAGTGAEMKTIGNSDYSGWSSQ